MNREILFRGKRVDNGEWIEGFFAKSGDKTFILIDNDIAVGYVAMKEVIAETVGQFTGLTDYNGKKIFEGDIVKGLFNFGLSINAKVVYYDGSFGVVCKRCGAINFTAFTSFCGVDGKLLGTFAIIPNSWRKKNEINFNQHSAEVVRADSKREKDD